MKRTEPIGNQMSCAAWSISWNEVLELYDYRPLIHDGERIGVALYRFHYTIRDLLKRRHGKIKKT
jgi:hypothetical protein